MRSLVISSAVLEKLTAKHGVTLREIEQCFDNRVGTYLVDDRDEHLGDDPTLWFVASTNSNRLLKVIFVYADGNVHIKSAYEPSQAVVDLYDKLGK